MAAFLSLPNRYLYQLKDLHLENSNLKTLAFIYLTDESEKTFENYKALGLPEQNWSKVLSSALNVNYNSCLAVRNNLFRSLRNEELKNKTKTLFSKGKGSFSSFKKQLGQEVHLIQFVKFVVLQLLLVQYYQL